MASTAAPVYTPLDFIPLIDHTSLGSDDDEAKIRQLVHDASNTAVSHPTLTTAAICIWPKFIKLAKSLNQNLPVATVINFPLGTDPIQTVVQQTQSAINHGADEIDLVINYKKLIQDPENGAKEVTELCKSVKAVCTSKVPLKVILETGELKTAELIEKASRAALEGGADMLKTSTGKVPVNATPEAARVMLETIRDFEKEKGGSFGFKAAGGVKSMEDGAVYLDLYREILGREATRSFRFGASSFLKVLVDQLEGNEPGAVDGGY